MVNVGIVWMSMDEAGVRVDVGVRLAEGIIRAVRVLMVSIVAMPMLVG